jgi:hypothetical protein
MYDDNIDTPEEIDRRALMSQMKTSGVATPRAGIGNAVAPTAADDALMGAVKKDVPAAEAPAEKPSYGKTIGQYGNRLEGFDAGKLSSDHASPKYLIGRTVSNFDPRKGVTPEVLDALNSLGIGKFAGSGDKVSIEGGDPRFEGVNSIDLVRGFKDPNGTGGWQFGAENTNAPQAPQGAPGAMAAAAPSAFQGIQALMPTDTNFYNTLQGKLQEILGGAPAFDRNALIAQMSR